MIRNDDIIGPLFFPQKLVQIELLALTRAFFFSILQSLYNTVASDVTLNK